MMSDWQKRMEYGHQDQSFSGEDTSFADDFLDDPPLCERFLDDSSRSAHNNNVDNKRLSAAADSKNQIATLDKSKENKVAVTEQDPQLRWLLAALLELLCSLLAKDNTKEQRQLFTMVARVLVNNNLISPAVLSDEVYPVRDHYRMLLGQALSQTLDVIKESNRTSVTHPNSLKPHNTGLYTNSPSPVHADNAGMANSFYPNRFQRDFVKGKLLGKGGFGEVFQATSRVDRCDYAIKSIAFDYRDLVMCFRVLREVQLLARLSHANIVRYYGTWFELDVTSRQRKRTESHEKPKIQELSEESDTNAHVSGGKLRKSISTPSISFVNSDSHLQSVVTSPLNNTQHSKDTTQSSPAGVASNKFWARRRSNTSSDEEENSNFLSVNANNAHALIPALAESPMAQAMPGRLFNGSCFSIFIQMELCPRTLRDYLTDRNKKLSSGKCNDRFSIVDSMVNQRLLRQLLKAVDYVHSRGLIHRDIKPSNIFLSANDMQVLLGDFGLACFDADADGFVDVQPMNNVPCADIDRRHSTGVGTFTYSAPEQLNTKFYSSKVDIFSVGVVAFEMYYPFRTYMEKMHIIMEVRKGLLPADFEERWPVEAGVIKQAVNPNSDLRPSAHQILEGNLFGSNEEIIESLEATVRDQASEIERLKKRVQRKVPL